MSNPSKFTIKDQRLIQRALRERWPIPKEVRDEVLLSTVDIALHSEKDEHKLRAANTLARFDTINLEDQKQQMVLQTTEIEFSPKDMDDKSLDSEIARLQALVDGDGNQLTLPPITLEELKEHNAMDYFDDPPELYAVKRVQMTKLKPIEGWREP
jgi:hypothetical protein